jgi:tetratricopeptide (TPR) repeat protein
MGFRTVVASIAALLVAAGPALAHDEHAGHEGHDHTGHDNVGTVTFANSCAPAVQADFARGVAMLHSFWYSAGEQTFRDVLAKDPGCAIATWGIASLLMSNPLAGVGPTPRDAEKAQAAIDQGRRIGAKTQRERDYIEAVAAYYQDWANRPERARQQARAAAYEALAARYPDDHEAQIFSALYIAGTQSQADQTYAAYARAASILEKEFAKYPDHPGVAHYLIHVYDAPPLAARGLTAARRYAGIAPDAPHALHMPSHIFTRVGAWEDSAATNSRSYAAAVKGNEFSEAYHASDYAVYADLQLARDAAARAAMEDAFRVKVTPATAASAYASAAMPARYAVERGDWRGAMQLTPPAEGSGGGVPYTEAITWFARALGAARTGDADAAEQDAAELAARHKKLVEAGNLYWATEVEVQQRAAAGWIAFARKQTEDALMQMRAAADLEDRNEKHIVTPGRILPARELLGDMLLEAGQPALALREYAASQQREPNRFRGYYGAARAAEEAGDRDKAAAYYEKLLVLAKDSDTERPELVRARAYVGQ